MLPGVGVRDAPPAFGVAERPGTGLSEEEQEPRQGQDQVSHSSSHRGRAGQTHLPQVEQNRKNPSLGWLSVFFPPDSEITCSFIKNVESRGLGGRGGGPWRWESAFPFQNFIREVLT